MANPFNDYQYMKICSEKTLQTNSKGFFMDFVQLVSDNAGAMWIKNVFGIQKSDIQRIKSLYDYEEVGNVIIFSLGCFYC